MRRTLRNSSTKGAWWTVVDGHRVYDSVRQDVTELQRASLKKHNLTVRRVSATEWRCAWVTEATASLVDDYELLVMIADEMQAYVKTRRPRDSDP